MIRLVARSQAAALEAENRQLRAENEELRAALALRDERITGSITLGENLQAQLAARRAATYVQALYQADPMADRLSDGLHGLLDGTVRTSATSENINSILRAYLWSGRYLRDRRTA